jgi:hypothetical protein
MLRRIQLFGRGQWIYLVHVLALLAPGWEMPTVGANPTPPGSLNGWHEEELKIMLDEGRRESDRQVADLVEIRSRAQWLFTFGTPLVVAVASVYAAIGSGDSGWWKVLWLGSLLAVGYGVVGAAAIVTVRADLNLIDTAVLSRKERPTLESLADDYATMMLVGQNTVATRVTLFRQAVVWEILGGYGALITWLAVR